MRVGRITTYRTNLRPVIIKTILHSGKLPRISYIALVQGSRAFNVPFISLKLDGPTPNNSPPLVDYPTLSGTLSFSPSCTVSGSVQVITQGSEGLTTDCSISGNANVSVNSVATLTLDNTSISGSSNIVVTLNATINLEDGAFDGQVKVLVTSTATLLNDDCAVEGSSSITVEASCLLAVDDSIITSTGIITELGSGSLDGICYILATAAVTCAGSLSVTLSDCYITGIALHPPIFPLKFVDGEIQNMVDGDLFALSLTPTNVLKRVAPPLTSSDSGDDGEFSTDSSYFYVYQGGQWLRTALSTF